MCAMVETLGLRTGSACPTQMRRGDPTDHAKFVEPLRELYEQVGGWFGYFWVCNQCGRK
jgi:hypothetical protein